MSSLPSWLRQSFLRGSYHETVQFLCDVLVFELHSRHSWTSVLLFFVHVVIKTRIVCERNTCSLFPEGRRCRVLKEQTGDLIRLPLFGRSLTDTIFTSLLFKTGFLSHTSSFCDNQSDTSLLLSLLCNNKQTTLRPLELDLKSVGH